VNFVCLKIGLLTLLLGFLAPCHAQNLVLNPGAEDPLPNGNLPFWEEVVGSNWGNLGAPTPPFEGFLYFASGNIAAGEAAQTIDVSSDSCMIDAGLRPFAFSCRVRSGAQTPADETRVVVEYRSGIETVLAEFNSGWYSNTTFWQLIENETTAPIGTRSIRIRLLTQRYSGNVNDGFFDDVRLVRVNNGACDCTGLPNGTFAIDACGVCLDIDDPQFNISCLDCAGVPNGSSVLDACGVCLLPNSLLFNQSCTDCAGVLNGEAVLDVCGVCLTPNDPLFGVSCLDCAGVANGSAVEDDCGLCLEPSDPAFNATCLDCFGVPNGTALLDDCGVCRPLGSPLINTCIDCLGILNGEAVVDRCGECRLPSDPEFGLSCEEGIYVPNAFTPNGDGLNDEFFPRIFAPFDRYTLSITDRWGGLVFYSESPTERWLGEGRIGEYYAPDGVYTWQLRLFSGTELIVQNGFVLLLR
jgi:gliding motility-associated-like protein